MSKKKKEPKTAKKTVPKVKTRLAVAPVRDLMKEAGADLVANDAIIAVVQYLEDRIKKVSKNAMDLVNLSKRKKVTGADIAKAITM
jgi:histone H3/H4